jgi:predicted metal-dependent phosphotriesterase family hydrolase
MSSVMTVLGPVDSLALGMALPHEHVFCDLMKEYRGDGLLHDVELAIAELSLFRRAGGGTLVECSTMDGRNPQGLRAVAERTGLNIVMGCGFYREPYLDRRWFDARDANEIARILVAECEKGVGDSRVRPGVLGEIGCDRNITAVEDRAFRAVARTHHQTGLSITTHAARWPVGLLQLDLLEEEGVKPGRVIVGHCDTVPDTGYHERIARRGAFVQFDTIRGGSEYETDCRIRYVMSLVNLGLHRQVLLSHDVCLHSMLKAMGGCGYDYIPVTFIPKLRAAGVDQATIEAITVDNPRRALTGEA